MVHIINFVLEYQIRLHFNIMAANEQIAIEPYSGTEGENFREFEQLFRGILGFATVPAGQQGMFLQIHLRDAALRYFQTLDAATLADVELALTALGNHFCIVQLQETVFHNYRNW